MLLLKDNKSSKEGKHPTPLTNVGVSKLCILIKEKNTALIEEHTMIYCNISISMRRRHQASNVGTTLDVQW